MIEPIPQDLAGYQHIITGVIQPGDIMVGKATRGKQWAINSVGRMIPDDEFDIYRKMACPKPGDHDKGWKEVAKTAEAAQRQWNPEKAKTNDSGKPPLAHLPWKGIREVSLVQAFGHKKYEDFHNYKKGMEVSRHLSCATRHIADFMDGNDLDTESGRNHLAHAACRLLFVLENLADGTAIDDRYKNKTK